MVIKQCFPGVRVFLIYGLLCLAVYGLLEVALGHGSWFGFVYQFDTRDIYPSCFSLVLFLVCVLVDPARREAARARLIAGGTVGLCAGVVAQAAVLTVESYRFRNFSAFNVTAIVFSFIVMSAVLLSPLWGWLVAELTSMVQRARVPRK